MKGSFLSFLHRLVKQLAKIVLEFIISHNWLKISRNHLKMRA
ncbi:UNVERIFIED_ORG: hypothetical protein QOE_3179 [Clostridioides difficile F501]